MPSPPPRIALLSLYPLFLPLLLLLTPSLPSVSSLIHTPSQPPLSTPVFRDGSLSLPLAQGWLGADAAYTLPLDPHRTLWLFDDTLSADSLQPPSTNRSHSHFVHNTVGLMTCDDARQLRNCSITYHWGDAERQQGFWLTGHEGDREPLFYWVLDAFIEHRTLHVFLQTTRNVPYGLNFEVVGSALVSVSNYDEEVTRWVKRYTTISNTNVSIVGQSAIHRTGPGGNPHPADPGGADYLYSHMFVSPPHAASQTVLMRFPSARLPNVSKEAGHWEYYTTKGSFVPWSSDPLLPPPGAATYWGEVGTVRWHKGEGEGEGEWINVAPSPRCFFGGGAVYSTSPNLTEGWTGYQDLYQTPETNSTSARYNKDAWCYSGPTPPHTTTQRPHAPALASLCSTLPIPHSHLSL